MTEAGKILRKRKIELERIIVLLEAEEINTLKTLESCRSSIKRRKRLLDEVLDVYNTLKKEID